MKTNKIVTAAVKNTIDELMERQMQKVLYDDPFIAEQHRASKPLYAALVPDEIFKGSHFERRFVTSFGSVWEKLAQIVAKGNGYECKLGHKIDGMVGEERLRRIQATLNALETSTKFATRKRPDWTTELKYIIAGGGTLLPTPVMCDLYLVKGKTKIAIELKAPLPNSDQTKVSKEKMFKLLAMQGNKVNEAYFALPYNPYGTKNKYAWTYPNRWFNMQSDACVLIGEEFWDKIGGEGAYMAFISQVNRLGKKYRQDIYTQYLGMTPPDDLGNIL